MLYFLRALFLLLSWYTLSMEKDNSIDSNIFERLFNISKTAKNLCSMPEALEEDHKISNKETIIDGLLENFNSGRKPELTIADISKYSPFLEINI